MSATFLPTAALDELRRIGDPDLAYNVAPLERSDETWHDVAEAQRLFARCGNEISAALMLAALPESYAAAGGSRVLAATRQLQHDLARRIRLTARFLLRVMIFDPSDDAPGRRAELHWETGAGAGANAADALRRIHQRIRRTILDPTVIGLPPEERVINQEDLLGMLLTFSIGVFEVLERFGIHWSDEQQRAYFVTWDVIGERLGIGTPRVRNGLGSVDLSRVPSLRPQTVVDGRVLLDQIRRRNWETLTDKTLPDQWESTDAGRKLLVALLHELQAAVPRRHRALPGIVIRELAPQIVRDRLGLGGSGTIGVFSSALSGWQPVAGIGSPLAPLRAAPLRWAAGHVTRAAIVHFIRNPLQAADVFTIPGLDDWVDAIRR